MKSVVILIILCGCIQVFGQERDVVRKVMALRVLHVTASDAETVLGQPVKSVNEFYKEYRWNDVAIDVEYSSGTCDNSNPWNVPKYTVTSIFLRFLKAVTSKQLGLSSKGFRRYPIKDVAGAFVFEDEVRGIEYTVTSRGRVESVSLHPWKADDSLYCPRQPSE